MFFGGYMGTKDVRESARQYFVPYILGNTALAHRLSAKIFLRYGIVSLICDQHPSFLGALDPSCRYVPLSPSCEPSLIADQLLSLCDQQPYTLPMIIPTTKQYAEIIEAERERFEHKFVLADSKTLFSSSPLADIP